MFGPGGLCWDVFTLVLGCSGDMLKPFRSSLLETVQSHQSSLEHSYLGKALDVYINALDVYGWRYTSWSSAFWRKWCLNCVNFHESLAQRKYKYQNPVCFDKSTFGKNISKLTVSNEGFSTVCFLSSCFPIPFKARIYTLMKFQNQKHTVTYISISTVTQVMQFCINQDATEV